PFTGRNQSSILVCQIDTGFSPQTHHRCILRYTVDAEPVSHRVKEHVARLPDRIVYRDRPVPFLLVACKTMAVKGRMARAVNRIERTQDAGFESGSGHEHLEYGTR